MVCLTTTQNSLLANSADDKMMIFSPGNGLAWTVSLFSGENKKNNFKISSAEMFIQSAKGWQNNFRIIRG